MKQISIIILLARRNFKKLHGSNFSKLTSFSAKIIHGWIILLFASLIMLVSCSEDKDITELAWTNNSNGAINEILWAGGDGGKGIWSQDGGYAYQATTEAKEIDTLAGEVECLIFDGEEFVAATVTISDTNSSSLALLEGESYTYTIIAVAKKK